jgi:sec-independent protein translocase protein TatC
MYLLKKLFQLRDKANPEHEKPFLEHLEDLRIMITRIVLALTISTVVCFIFRDQLMEILRRPVVEVWEKKLDEELPDKSKLAQPLDVESWEEAKKTADLLSGLSDQDRAVFFQQCGDPDLRFQVETVFLYRAAQLLPTDRRDAFLNSLSNLNPELRQQVAALLESGPSPKVDDREDLRMMGAFNPTEAFMLSIKLAFFAGIVVAFPLLFLFIMQFVLPGLHENEKRAMWPAIAIGFGLFLVGVLFAYLIVLPRVLEFFRDYAADMGIANEWRIGYYISFATQFTLIFGLSFELPVVVMTLVKLGILGWDTMRRTRSYAVLAIFVIAAVITPTPDAFTLCLLAGPMVLLYEICIWLAWWLHRKEIAAEAAEEKERIQYRLDHPEGPRPDHPDHPFEHQDPAPSADPIADPGETTDRSDPVDPPRDIDPFTEYEDPYAELYDDPYAGSKESTDSDTGEADTGDADTGDADTGDADTGDADTGDADTGDADTKDADTGEADGDHKTSNESDPNRD